MTFPVVLAVFGAIAWLFGLLGSGRSRYLEFHLTSRSRIFAFVIGAVLITIAGLSFYRTPSTTVTANSRNQSAAVQKTLPAPQARPEALFEIIRELQRRHVRESHGENANESFTDADLASFASSDVPQQVVTQLRRDNRFIDVVRAIKNMDAVSRQALLNSAATTAKPTWQQLGTISRNGQTEAGRKAELLVAEAVTALARDLVLLPDEKLVEMYR